MVRYYMKWIEMPKHLLIMQNTVSRQDQSARFAGKSIDKEKHYWHIWRARKRCIDMYKYNSYKYIWWLFYVSIHPFYLWRFINS